MVLVSFRAHLISGTINLIATIFTAIALFSCHWLDYGFLHFGLASTCTFHASSDSAAWVNVSLAFIIIAFFFQILGILHLLGTSAYRKFNNHVLKVDVLLTTLSLLCLLVCVLVFGISADNNTYSLYSFGYSFIMACIALGISLFAYLPAVHAFKKIRDCGDCDCDAFEW